MPENNINDIDLSMLNTQEHSVSTQPTEARISIERGSISLNLDRPILEIQAGLLSITSSPKFNSGNSVEIKSDITTDSEDFVNSHGVLAEFQTHNLGTEEHRISKFNQNDNIIAGFITEPYNHRGGILCEESITDHLRIDDNILAFKSGSLVDTEDNIILPDNFVDDELKIEHGTILIAPRNESVSSEGNYLLLSTIDTDFVVKEGVFEISPSTELASQGQPLIDSESQRHTLVFQEGTLIPGPTDELIRGNNRFLEFNAHQETLNIKDEALALTRLSAIDTELSIKTQGLLSTIEWKCIGDELEVDLLEKTRVQSNFLDLSDSYTNLLTSNENGSNYLTLPDSVAVWPPHEYYNNARLIKEITSPNTYIDQSEEVYRPKVEIGKYIPPKNLLSKLESLDSGLSMMLQGALQSLSSSNPDRSRHLSVSLRELFNHVIHTLAPDEAIREWDTDAKEYHNNRPTRRTRLRYICREIDQGSFEDFMESDIDSILHLINIFNKGTHKIKSPYVDSQMKAMLVRSENAIRFLIEVSEI